MAISANTLFHFTKFNYLRSIIEDGYFLPRYSFEMFNCQEKFIVAYPMVCFCDISLSQITSHAKDYHKNGIGLTKTWGQTNKINPVLYIQKESYVHEILINLLNKQNFHSENGSSYLKVTDSLLREKIFKLFELSAFFKPSRGKIWEKTERSFKLKSLPKSNLSRALTKNFYNEREWRFVPNILDKRTDNKNLIPINFIPEIFFKDNDGNFSNEIFESHNKKLKEFKLPFKSEDVKYIIVEGGPQMHDLIDHIQQLDKYSPLDKNHLITKIITLKQIQNDF